MMGTVFFKILNMSLAAGWVILAVIIMRLIFAKAPKWIRCVMWGIAAVRLVCPFFPESGLSLMPGAGPFKEDMLVSAVPEINSGIYALDRAVNPILSESLRARAEYSANPMQIAVSAASFVWIAGMAVMFIYTLASYIKIRKKLREAVWIKENIWICDHTGTPFISRILRPKIYLPSGCGDTEYVTAHEKMHIQRKDHLWKPLGFMILSVYWFNPLVWVSYILFCRDAELACDEKVLEKYGAGIKKPYSEALVNCSASRKASDVLHPAFGENSIKGRVKNILGYKKPDFRIIAAAAAVCAVMAVCFLSNPEKREREIYIDGNLYVQEGGNRSELPEKSAEIGILKGVLHRTEKHPSKHLTGSNLDEKYAGCPVYQSSTEENTVYLKDYSGFYIPFVCDGN